MRVQEYCGVILHGTGILEKHWRRGSLISTLRSKSNITRGENNMGKMSFTELQEEIYTEELKKLKKKVMIITVNIYL